MRRRRHGERGVSNSKRARAKYAMVRVPSPKSPGRTIRPSSISRCLRLRKHYPLLGENVKIKVAGRRCRPQLPGFFRRSSSNGTHTTSRIGAGFSCAGGLGPKVEDALGRDLVVDVGNDLERISAAFAHERVGGI